MTLYTLGDIIDKINDDLDLTNEVMISDTELLGYINQAIRECEQHVITIYEDYFLQPASLALTSGTQDYDLPTNIYAHKVRRILYDDGSTKYEIKQLKNLSEIPNVQAADDYRYRVIMNSSGEFKIRLFPTSRETSASNVTVWHIGSARMLSANDDVMNIPEAFNYIVTRAKLECVRKEGHPQQATLEEDAKVQRDLLIDTLSCMIPDEDNSVQVDYSFYQDFDLGGY